MAAKDEAKILPKELKSFASLVAHTDSAHNRVTDIEFDNPWLNDNSEQQLALLVWILRSSIMEYNLEDWYTIEEVERLAKHLQEVIPSVVQEKNILYSTALSFSSIALFTVVFWLDDWKRCRHHQVFNWRCPMFEQLYPLIRYYTTVELRFRDSDEVFSVPDLEYGRRQIANITDRDSAREKEFAGFTMVPLCNNMLHSIANETGKLRNRTQPVLFIGLIRALISDQETIHLAMNFLSSHFRDGTVQHISGSTRHGGIRIALTKAQCLNLPIKPNKYDRIDSTDQFFLTLESIQGRQNCPIINISYQTPEHIRLSHVTSTLWLFVAPWISGRFSLKEEEFQYMDQYQKWCLNNKRIKYPIGKWTGQPWPPCFPQLRLIHGTSPFANPKVQNLWANPVYTPVPR